jgi:dUTPase
MPDEDTKPAVTIDKRGGIPLYLISNVIEALVIKHGDEIFQIHVVRKQHHKFTITVENKAEQLLAVNPESPAPEEGDGHG